MRTGFKGALLLTTACSALLAGPAPAQQYWDGANTTPGNVANGRGGNGAWNATATNWTDAAGTANAAWDRRGAVFAGAPGTVTIDGTQVFRELRFTTNGYRLVSGTAGALDLRADGATIYSSDVTTTTIGVDIRGTGGFEIRGTGLIAFDGVAIAPGVSIQQSRANFSNVTARNITAVGSDIRLAGSTAADIFVTGLGHIGDIQGSTITTLVGQAADLSTDQVTVRGSSDLNRPVDSILVNNGSGQFANTNVDAMLDTVIGIYGFNARIGITGTTVTTGGDQSIGIGVRASVVDIANTRVTTSGEGSRGIVAAAGSTMNLTGGRVATLGDTDADGYGAYALATEIVGDPNAVTTLNATGATIYTQGTQGIGAGTEGGTINLRGGTIVTGIRLNADGTPAGVAGGISAQRIAPLAAVQPNYIASGADQGIGVGALNGVVTIARDSNDVGTVIQTYGNAAPGLGATGSASAIRADGVDVSTRGTIAASPLGNIASHAVAATDGATVTVNDSQLATAGAFASGAFVLGTGTVNVTNSMINAQSGALEIAPGTGGSNRITVGNSILEGADAIVVATFGGNDQVANFDIDASAGTSSSGTLLTVRRSPGATNDYISLNATGGTQLGGDINALEGTTVILQGNVGGGPMRMLSGALSVNGTISNSSVEVASGATLQGPTSLPAANGPTPLGAASIIGPVTIANGATLGGIDSQTLTMGSLMLNDMSIVRAEIGSQALTAPLFDVTGGLTLDGRLTIVQRDGFGDGSYRLFDYGTLTANNGLVINNVPTGYNPGDFAIDLATAGQINLIVQAGANAQYWDGVNQTPGMEPNGRGGDGTWNATNTNWTNRAGTINAPWASGNAVFASSGNRYIQDAVVVEGQQGTTGLTFLPGARYAFSAGANGGLVLNSASTPIVVDQLQEQNDSVVELALPVSGVGMLVKQGTGSLELRGANSYAGGTRVEGGRLYVPGGGALPTGPTVVTGAQSMLLFGATIVDQPVGSGVSLGDVDLRAENGGTIYFASGSNAGTARFTVGGLGSGQARATLSVLDTDLGSPTIALQDGGTFDLQGYATAGGATVTSAAGSRIDLSQSDGEFAPIGSLSGAGDVTLGTVAAQFGALGRDDVISGIIGDGAGPQGQVGSRGIVKVGTGTLMLTGANTYAGLTDVTGGRLLVNGSVAGDVRVGEQLISRRAAPDAAAIEAVTSPTLGGSGAIGGAVAVEDGAVLEGVAGQALQMASLSLDPGASVNVVLAAPSDTRLFDVTGNLTLDGTLTVTDAGGYGDGVYRLFDYGGALTDNGLDVASLPGGTGIVQTALANQVNLVVSGNTTPTDPTDPTDPVDPVTPAPDVQFWNGVTTVAAGTVVGGSGIWTNAPVTNWTDANGSRADAWGGKFAVFQGAPGAVQVDGSVGPISAQGLQFIGQGWNVTGDAITLAGANGATTIRVGDGSVGSAADVAVVDASLTGASTLVKDDLGTLVLTGTNDYSGGTRVANGTLRIGNGGASGSIVGDVAVDGTLEFARSDAISFGGAISGRGRLGVSSGGLTLTADNPFTGATGIAEGATLRLGDGGTSGSLAGPIDAAGTLVFDCSDRFSYGGVVSGAGTLRQVGSGATVLTGASGGFTGTTRIEAGMLAVNGALGGTVMVAGGRLQGSGTIGDLGVAAGSTVAPGNSIGTLSVTGNVGFAPGSTYEVEVDASGAADRIAASGAATIAGGDVSVLAAAGRYALSTDYTIITAGGGVSGVFDGVASNSAFLQPSLAYGPTSVTLRLTRNGIDLASVGGTPNQRAAGAAVDALGGGPVFGAALLLDAGEAQAGFDSLSGEIHPSARTAMLEDSRLPREAVLRRLASAPDEGRGAWGELFGNWGGNDADGNAARLRRDTKGFVAGIDAAAGEHVRIGIAGGYGDTDLAIGRRESNGSLKSAHVLAYAGASYGGLRLKAGLGYAHVDIDTRRQVAFPGFSDSLKAKYDGRLLQGFAEIGYALPLGGGTVEPFAGIAHVDARTDGFRERGGEAALSAGKRYESYTASTLGARLTTPVAGALSAHATFGWRHGFGDLTQRTRVAFAGAAPFAVAGAPVSRDAGIGEFGATLRLSPRLTLDASYTGALGDRSVDNAARAHLSFAF